MSEAPLKEKDGQQYVRQLSVLGSRCSLDRLKVNGEDEHERRTYTYTNQFVTAARPYSPAPLFLTSLKETRPQYTG